MLSASNGRLGGLRAQSHLAPRAFALSGAATAFDAQGALTLAAPASATNRPWPRSS